MSALLRFAYIVTSSLVNIILSLFGFSLMVCLLFAFAQLNISTLPVVYFWSVLCFVTFDSLIGACAAIAKNAEQANATYLPFQVKSSALLKRRGPGI